MNRSTMAVKYSPAFSAITARPTFAAWFVRSRFFTFPISRFSNIMRNLLTLADVSAAEIQRIFSITEDLKTKFAQGLREPLLPGRVLALLFEKQSLRTRVSFEAGMSHLGGSSLMLGDDAGFGKRESVADFARVLSKMVDVVVVRAKRHATVEEFARYSACSVINGLTDLAHPCQALAD